LSELFIRCKKLALHNKWNLVSRLKKIDTSNIDENESIDIVILKVYIAP